MQRYVAFLRAINVGKRIVRMEQLRELFEEVGFGDVQTFIASGNVIFETRSSDVRALETRIERQLLKGLGYTVDTFVRTPAELIAIADAHPFVSSDELNTAALYVSFLRAPPVAAAQTRLLSYRSPVDEFAVKGAEAYWLCRKKMSESSFTGALLEKAVGTATARNITTVNRIADKFCR